MAPAMRAGAMLLAVLLAAVLTSAPAAGDDTPSSTGTQSSTTPAVTTAAPTTPAATTASPTTPAATTASPTTPAATTASPTTPATPTASPTTPATPTASPTTPATPTASPTTPAATTASPTTPAATTASPTTPATPTAPPTTPATPPTTPATPTAPPTVPAATTASPAASSTAAAPAPGSTALNIFFVNDLQYRLLPTTTDTSADLCQSDDITTCFGGLVGLNSLRTGSTGSGVWLHAGAALGEYMDAYEDYYLQLKHATAVEALNLLSFDGMSVDADMFRFGKGREVVSQLNGKSVVSCANCNASMTEAALQPFRRFTPNGSSCDVVVIGVLNRRKALAHLPRAVIADEVEAVKDAVSKAKAANSAPALYVVVGEMESATVDKVLALEGVSVVLSSGTVADGAGAVSKISDGKDKISSTLPAQLARAMNVGQLALTLDDKCAPTNVQDATVRSYRATKNDAATDAGKQIVTKALSDIKAKAMLNVKSAVALSADLDPCGFISCALGQMAADGVHALVNAPDLATAAVIIPAGSFAGTLPTAFNWTTLLSVAPNDPYFCRKTLTTEQLYGLLDDLLGTGPSFPQVSGLLVDQYPAEDGLRMVNVWTRTPGLAMRPVPRDTTTNVTVAMPCLALEASRRVGGVQAGDATGVTLSQGLERSLLQQGAAAGERVLVLPPQVEQRVRLYIADQPRVDCEDWVGMTVTYTLLVIGSVIMLAYQGYQLWRFRTTLTYIR